MWGAVIPNRWSQKVDSGTIIPPVPDKPKPPADYSEGCWIKPRGSTSSAASDTFRLLFRGQHLGEKYTVKLRFFGPFAPADLNTWISSAYNAVFDQMKSNQPPQATDVAKIFQDAVQARIQPLIQDGKAVWQIRSEREGDCNIVSSPPVVTITRAQRDLILKAALEDVQNDTRSTQIDQAQEAIEKFRTDPRTELLRNRLEELAATSTSALLRGDGDSLWRAVQRREAPPENVMARLESFNKNCRIHLTANQCGALDLILDAFFKYATSHAVFVEKTAFVEQTRRQITLTIEDVFAPVALAEFTSTSWEEAPALADRVRIGTAVSFGAAPLGLGLRESGNYGNADAHWESFALYTLKYYRYPVDKSLPDPYLGRFPARFSLAFGVLRGSDLRYQGQKLSSFGGNLTPAVGIGFDITRDFTLQLGTLFFREQTGERLNPNNDTRARGSLFLSLGVDIDAANRVNTLLKGIINN